MMRAAIRHVYGPPEVVKVEQVPKPKPKPNEVLIKVEAASCNAGDWHLLRADPFPVRFAFGLVYPTGLKILGGAVAGTIEAVGANVTKFKAGDAVFGDTTAYGCRGFAEYVALDQKYTALKPAALSMGEAAALPVAATSAHDAVIKHAKVQQGQKVLINGASGGVGHFCVQIAKAYGAEVTGVCSTDNVEMVRALGADKVIDYKKEDFAKGKELYDSIIDCASHHSVYEVKNVLKPGGKYILVGGDTMMHTVFAGGFLSLFSGKTFKLIFSGADGKLLESVAKLADEGKLRPSIEKVYDSLEQVPDALHHIEAKRVKGKIVINIA